MCPAFCNQGAVVASADKVALDPDLGDASGVGDRGQLIPAKWKAAS